MNSRQFFLIALICIISNNVYCFAVQIDEIQQEDLTNFITTNQDIAFPILFEDIQEVSRLLANRDQECQKKCFDLAVRNATGTHILRLFKSQLDSEFMSRLIHLQVNGLQKAINDLKSKISFNKSEYDKGIDSVDLMHGDLADRVQNQQLWQYQVTNRKRLEEAIALFQVEITDKEAKIRLLEDFLRSL